MSSPQIAGSAELIEVVAVSGTPRRVWVSGAGLVYVLVRIDGVNTWQVLDRGRLTPVGAWPTEAPDLTVGDDAVAGSRQRWLQPHGRSPQAELAVLTAAGSIRTRKFDQPVTATAWTTEGLLVALGDGTLEQLDVELTTTVRARLLEPTAWPLTTALGSQAASPGAWAATWTRVARLGTDLRPEVVHEVPVAPVRTEQLMVSAGGERVACRSPYASVVLDDSGRLAEDLGCARMSVGPGAELLGLSDHRWMKLWGTVLNFPERHGIATLDCISPTRIAASLEKGLTIWEKSAWGPVKIAEAGFSRTARSLVSLVPDQVMVAAGELYVIKLAAS